MQLDAVPAAVPAGIEEILEALAGQPGVESVTLGRTVQEKRTVSQVGEGSPGDETRGRRRAAPREVASTGRSPARYRGSAGRYSGAPGSAGLERRVAGGGCWGCGSARCKVGTAAAHPSPSTATHAYPCTHSRRFGAGPSSPAQPPSPPTSPLPPPHTHTGAGPGAVDHQGGGGVRVQPGGARGARGAGGARGHRDERRRDARRGAARAALHQLSAPRRGPTSEPHAAHTWLGSPANRALSPPVFSRGGHAQGCLERTSQPPALMSSPCLSVDCTAECRP